MHQHLVEARRHGFELSSDGKLKAAPRGFSRDHPEIDLLRHPNLALLSMTEPGPWLAKPACYTRVRDGWLHIRRWNNWLADHRV